MEKKIYSVNDINKYIKTLLTNDEHLKYVFVKGEISNCKIAPTGHIYFSLKDNDSIIGAVMFNNLASTLSFIPKNGDEVIVMASVDVYTPRGNYQLFVYNMSLNGQGSILEEFEKLKKKLANEGLFDEARKRPINIYPRALGIITAPNSAALKDLLFNIKRRYPIVDIYVFPSSVQGENAPKELLKAFLTAQSYEIDTLIIGRGGGASEDLSAFNDEALVRAIANSKMPVIAAVGHEIDSTLVDFVADKRASTPTGAAELATVDQREISQTIAYAISDMQNSLKDKVNDMKENVSSLREDMKLSLTHRLENYRSTLVGYRKELNALNPKAILSRGYSITTDSNGKTICNAESLKKGETIFTNFSDGRVKSNVEEVING